MLFEIEALTSSGQASSYDQAKSLGRSLEHIRAEFKALQTKEVDLDL
jgi:hypothetical protein